MTAVLRGARAALGAAALAAACLAPCALRAEVLLEDKVQWQEAGLPAGLKAKDVEALTLRRNALKSRVWAKVRVTNRSPESVEGILLSYAVSARVVSGQGSAEGSWAVPFLLEQKRVPKIGAQQTIETRLDPTVGLKLYVARMARLGFRLLELRLQVMVEPRRGEPGALRTIESVVKIFHD